MSIIALAAMSIVGVLQPMDLGPLAPGGRWLQTERLRAELRHLCNIGPFIDAALTAEGGGTATPVSLRGTHVLLLQHKRGDDAAVIVRAVDGRAPFSDTIWALFRPDGEMADAGRVGVGKEGTVRIHATMDGIYRLLLNSGPASSNAARVTVGAPRWAVEMLGLGSHLEDPLYYHSLRDFKLAGLNLDMLDFEGLRQEFMTDAGLAKWTAAVGKWGEHARRFQMRLMPAVDLGGTSYEVEAWKGCRPGLYVKHFENYPLAPCPLDTKGWEQVFQRRARAVAKLSAGNPYLVGVGIDPEMYQAWDYGHYMLSGTCFCDYCLGGFLRSKDKPLDILAQLKTGAERHQWVEQQGLMGDYDKYLEGETYKIAVNLREELHKINPRFLLCVYVLEIGNWFCRGLARGLGTPEAPVIDYAEATYFVGWVPGAQAQIQRFKDWGANVAYGGTLYYASYPPGDPNALAAQMYNFCMRGGGYWLWPGQEFHTSWDSVPTFRGVAAPQADYWHAMALANSEVERKMAAPATYESPLADIKPGTVFSVEPKPTEGWARPAVERLPLRLAGPTKLYFLAPARPGEVSVVVQAPGADNGASVKLVRPDGSVAAEASGELDEPTRLKAPGTGGVWALDVARGEMPLRDVGVRVEHAPPYVCTGAKALLQPTPKRGSLLAWWPLDEGKGEVAHDRSGPPPADGAVGNCKWAQDARGPVLELGGEHSRVFVPHNYNLDDLREFTLSARVKLRRLPVGGHGQSIINKGPEAPVQHFWWWIGYPPDYPLILEMGNEKTQWGTGFTSKPLTWEIDRWYAVAVACRWDGKQSVARFYRDGQFVGEATKDEEFHSAQYDVYLGAYWGGDMHGLDGFLSDVRILDKALGEAEAQDLTKP